MVSSPLIMFNKSIRNPADKTAYRKKWFKWWKVIESKFPEKIMSITFQITGTSIKTLLIGGLFKHHY